MTIKDGEYVHAAGTAKDDYLIMDKDSGESVGLIYQTDPPEIGEGRRDFVIKACNSHYELLEQANYIDSAIGGEPGEDYADEEVIEIRVTGAFIKQLKQAIQNATK